MIVSTVYYCGGKWIACSYGRAVN